MNLKGEIEIFKARLANMHKRTLNFSKIFPWVFREFLGFAWQKVLGLLAIAGVSAGFRVAVIATLLGTVRKLAKQGSGATADGLIDIPYIGSVDYVLFGALVLVFFVLNAGVSFMYERAVFRTASSYQPQILRRALRVYAKLPNIHYRLDLPPRDRLNIVASIGRHSRLVTIFLRIILFSAIGLLSAIGCYILLLFINTYITLIFTFIILIFFPVFYYLSLKGLRARERMPIAVGNLYMELRPLDRKLQSPMPKTSDVSDELIDGLVDGPVAFDAFDAFLQQRFVIFKAQFASGILAATILAISITIFFASFRDSDAFGDDFALFFALLYVMGTSLSSSLRALVSGNRFFGTLKFLYVLLGPESNKEPFKSGQKGSTLAFERSNGDMLAFSPGADVYLYIAGAKRRFDFQPVVNRLLPAYGRSSSGDGSLVYLKSKEVAESYERNGTQDLVFIHEQALAGASGSAQKRTAFLNRLFGTQPRFIVLKQPLESPPRSKGQWVYIWGSTDRLVGDIANGESTEFPSAKVLRSRLESSKRGARSGGSIDEDEFEF